MSEKAKVYFGSVQQGRQHAATALAVKVDKIVENLDFSTIEKKDKVAIKMHLGFDDGYQTVPVFFVRRIVKAIKEAGGWPFVTDNPTAVYNAVERGYTEETCGCPIIPIAGVKDGYTKKIKIGYRNVKTLDMAGVLRDADVLINLTHAKGHACCAYGGAIKNIALGGYAGPSRWHKIHGVEHSVPYWDPEKCTPEHAKKLVESCPYNAIRYDEKKHKLTIMLFGCQNTSCMECQEVDKGIDSLKILPEMFNSFQEMMAISAKHVLDHFSKEKTFFLNFALEITPHCDCMGMAQPCIVPDVGVLGSRDIVALETATLDLMAEAGLIEQMIPPYIKHANLDPKANLHPFQRVWGPMKDPYLVLEYAVKQGLGGREYELVEILNAEKASKEKPEKQEYERQPSFF